MKAVCNTIAVGADGMPVSLTTALDIPFIPMAGNLLSVTPNGDYFAVDEVFWSCLSPDEVEVYLTNLSASSAELLVDAGWHIEVTTHA